MDESIKSKSETVKVVVRCRPMSKKEKSAGHHSVVKLYPADGVIEVFNRKLTPKYFLFDAVYDCGHQTEIYDEVFRPLVDSVINGFNGTVFAYGQTGAGKTYTMEGNIGDPEHEGVIPNSFKHIFSHIARSENTQFLVSASYLEIYQENVRDLLSPDPKKKLDVRERNDTGVYVKDLTVLVCKTIQELEKVMIDGKRNRSIGTTNMNAHSSRSHAIFIISIESCESDTEGNKHVKIGKLNLVDLAGSEKQSKTGAVGYTQKESIKINLSVSALGKVISALVDGKSTHVPYRDSKLTRLLQDSLGGNAITIMIANIGPSSYNYDETITTLWYANKAKNIKNKPVVNISKDAILLKYKEEISHLKAQLALKEAKRKKKKENKIIEGDVIEEMEHLLMEERVAYLNEQNLMTEEKEKNLRDIKAKDEELRMENEAKEKIKSQLQATVSPKMFSPEKLEEKFASLTRTTDCIDSLSTWIIRHKKFMNEIVNQWLQALKKDSDPLTLLYVANDVVHKDKEFREAFASILEKVFSLQKVKDIKDRLTCMLIIWHDMAIYDVDFLEKLVKKLDESETEKEEEVSEAEVIANFKGPAATQQRRIQRISVTPDASPSCAATPPHRDPKPSPSRLRDPYAQMATSRQNPPPDIAITLHARITKINIERFAVDLTSKSSDLSDKNNELRPPKDLYYDFEAEEKDTKTKEDTAKKQNRQVYLKHVPPSFKNVSFKEAEKILESMDQGDVIIRPSSKQTVQPMFNSKQAQVPVCNPTAMAGSHHHFEPENPPCISRNPPAETLPAPANYGTYTPSRLYGQENEEELIKQFGLLEKYEESEQFLSSHPHLACYGTLNYLVIWCINLEVEKKHESMENVAHQNICMQFILKAAKECKVNPQAFISLFFSRIQTNNKYKEAFNIELQAFKLWVKERARIRIEEAEQPVHLMEPEKQALMTNVKPAVYKEQCSSQKKINFEKIKLLQRQDKKSCKNDIPSVLLYGENLAEETSRVAQKFLQLKPAICKTDTTVESHRLQKTEDKELKEFEILEQLAMNSSFKSDSSVVQRIFRGDDGAGDASRPNEAQGSRPEDERRSAFRPGDGPPEERREQKAKKSFPRLR